MDKCTSDLYNLGSRYLLNELAVDLCCLLLFHCLGFGFNFGNGTVSAYCISKMALNAFTSKLALDVKEDGILVNSVCPGYTASSEASSGGRPVQDGAASIVWACTLPADGPTGGFFRDGKPLPF